MSEFEQLLRDIGGGAVLRALDLSVLLVSLTLRCNMACGHCHVSSGPARTETMPRDVMDRVVDIASSVGPQLVDITGGAPELHPRLPEFLSALREQGLRVQLRTNLTILEDPRYREMTDVYAANGVELLASMPCYSERNTRAARGPGVLDSSVRVLRRLNALGYGADGGLRLGLIYNPVGTTLPEPQESLDALFHDELAHRFGVTFTHVLTMTNMPVGRFREKLVAEGGYDRYIRALRESFNPDVAPLLECRRQVEIGSDGRLYDCDFNLGSGVPVDASAPRDVWEFDAERLAHRRIAYGDQCFGCAAGAGSS